VRDEQGNNVTFAEGRTAVQGGGVIHTVNAVSDADIYGQKSRCCLSYTVQPQQQQGVFKLHSQTERACLLCTNILLLLNLPLLLPLLLLLLLPPQVLQPNDIFPSLTAALANPDFSVLSGVLQQIDAGLNITLLADLEKTPGTLAAPTNEVCSRAKQQQLRQQQL
jgi:hypothetical protein